MCCVTILLHTCYAFWISNRQWLFHVWLPTLWDIEWFLPARKEKWTKHINMCSHHFREHVCNGLIKIYPIGTKDQIADVLTKAIPQNDLQRHRKAISGVWCASFIGRECAILSIVGVVTPWSNGPPTLSVFETIMSLSLLFTSLLVYSTSLLVYSTSLLVYDTSLLVYDTSLLVYWYISLVQMFQF